MLQDCYRRLSAPLRDMKMWAEDGIMNDMSREEGSSSPTNERTEPVFAVCYTYYVP